MRYEELMLKFVDGDEAEVNIEGLAAVKDGNCKGGLKAIYELYR